VASVYCTDIVTNGCSRYVDPKTKHKFEARAAFQLLVQPGSYKIGPPSVAGVGKPIDPHVDHDATEWVTKERGATMLCALLVKLDGL
jgi:neuralized-like protein 4